MKSSSSEPEKTDHNGQCLKIGLVGPSLKELLQLINRPDFKDAFPGLKVTGVAALEMEKDARDEALKHPVEVYDHPNDLAATRKFDLVLDLLDEEQASKEFRQALPADISILERKAARCLWHMLTEERLCLTCKRDLQASQNLFTTVIDQLEEDILLLDPEGRILDMNTNVYAHRRRNKEELLGLRCWELEGRAFCCKEAEGCTFRETLTTGRKAEALHNIVDDEGRIKYWRVYTYPVFNNNHEITHIVEVRRDITNRTHMEMRLQQSEKLAAIGELATYIAHEIRNPLFAIGGFANSLLRSASLDEPSREKVGIVLQESKRLDSILKSILNFARPTEAKEGQLNLNKVVKETTDLMRIGFESQGGEVKLETEQDLPMAKADGELIKQCLINLIKNAMEAMPNGGVLTVRTSMDNKYLALEVEDTGPGIPSELRDRVFNPFFSTKDKGSGLGLAMTKKILEDMGGQVELSSQPEKGTKVTLLIPPMLAVDKEIPDAFTSI